MDASTKKSTKPKEDKHQKKKKTLMRSTRKDKKIKNKVEKKKE